MKKKQICLWSTKEELTIMERLKKHHARKTFSDLLRFLILQENEKILAKNITNSYNQTGENK